MAVGDLLSFAGQAMQAAKEAVATAIEIIEDPGPVHRALGQGVSMRDNEHAILLVREAPRVGTDVSKDSTLRRHLESVELVPRTPTGRVVFATDDFILESLQEPDNERYAVVYNLGNPAIQASSPSGRRHRMFTYQGSLLVSDSEGSSFVRHMEAWDQYLRAFKLAVGEERVALPYVVELIYRDQIRRGYPTSMTVTRSAEYRAHVSFSIELFIVHASTIGNSLPLESNETSDFKSEASEVPFGPQLPPENLSISLEDFF